MRYYKVFYNLLAKSLHKDYPFITRMTVEAKEGIFLHVSIQKIMDQLNWELSEPFKTQYNKNPKQTLTLFSPSPLISLPFDVDDITIIDDIEKKLSQNISNVRKILPEEEKPYNAYIQTVKAITGFIFVP